MTASELWCDVCGDVAVTSDDDGMFSEGTTDRCESCGHPGHVLIEDADEFADDVDDEGNPIGFASWADDDAYWEHCRHEKLDGGET